MKTTSPRGAGTNAQGEPVTNDLDSTTGSIHFIGIGGIGMSALARLILARGKSVSGSDKEANPITDELAALGATIHIGHDARHIDGASLIVVSTAITDANPELSAARQRGLPILHRSGVLQMLTSTKKVIAISGTHGKTTTTGMMSQVFLDGGLDPEVVVGGVFSRIGSNSHAGKGEFFVAEADESDRTHAQMKSFIAMVTNIEPDHLENYPGGMSEICDNMISFANGATNCVVLCLDDEGCRTILPRLTPRVVTYGMRSKSPDAHYSYESTAAGMRIYKQNEELGEVRMAVPGEHNRINALGTLATALEVGIPFKTAANAMAEFTGVARRFQLIGTKNGITVVDDYGHHPTEVRATLEAAKQYMKDKPAGRIVAVFQPHQPGRLRDLWKEFCESFTDADLVLVADIYVARGGNIDGINSERFVTEVHNRNSQYMNGSIAELAPKITPLLKSGDLVLTIGAGDITKLGAELLKQL